MLKVSQEMIIGLMFVICYCFVFLVFAFNHVISPVLSLLKCYIFTCSSPPRFASFLYHPSPPLPIQCTCLSIYTILPLASSPAPFSFLTYSSLPSLLPSRYISLLSSHYPPSQQQSDIFFNPFPPFLSCSSSSLTLTHSFLFFPLLPFKHTPLTYYSYSYSPHPSTVYHPLAFQFSHSLFPRHFLPVGSLGEAGA